jgi:hypothetical protein
MINCSNTFRILLLFILIVAINSCKKETIEATPVSLNYFPTSVGTWTEYIVDSVYHGENDNNNDDSVYSYHFFIREVIDSSFEDIEGRVIQTIKRYRKNDSLDNWTLSNVWTQRLSPVNAYRTEDNVSLHKLSFPISSSVSWNANDANTLDEENNFYEYFHEPGGYADLNFDSTLSVIQINENNYIARNFGNEIYATGVGLIYKERDELRKKNGIVVAGMEYKMVISGFGRE